METTICNLCGNAATQPFATVPDLLLERLNVTATLVRCTQCDLVYQNPRPTLSEMDQHYPPEYEPYTDHAEQRKSNWLLQKAIEYGIQKRCHFITKHKAGGRILDIGCAAGTFLLGMQAQGKWQTYGVEISPEVARIARKRHNLNVFTGTLEEAAFADQMFDAVTMWDVLEHVHDPTATLREIRRILKPDGLLLVRVPNLASWDAQLFGKTWAGLDAPRHLYVFTPDTLTQMLAQAGFRVANHSCAIGGYVTFALSVRFWLSARHRSAATKQRVSRILYHPLARLASAPFFYLPTLIMRGPLLVTTAQKVHP